MNLRLGCAISQDLIKNQNKNLGVWGGEVTQWQECLLFNSKDQSLDASSHVKQKLSVTTHRTLTPLLGNRSTCH